MSKEAYRTTDENNFRGTLCPICGREFYPTPEWGWKDSENLYCRYSCMRKAERMRHAGGPKKKPARRRGKSAREDLENLTSYDETRIRMIQEGAAAEEINRVSLAFLETRRDLRKKLNPELSRK